MTVLKLILAGLRRRPATWAFHMALLAVAVGVILSIGLIRQATEDRLARDLAGVDLVVGASGSPIQLILSTLLASDAPTGNIPHAVWVGLSNDPLVAHAVPVSLGDSVGDVRIVGTTPDYAGLYDAELTVGRWWEDSFQAVLGADAARRLGRDVGDTFVGAHGMATTSETHDEHPYRVIGILAPTGTVVDRLALTSLESVWDLHNPEAYGEEGAHHDQATHGEEHGHAEDAPREVTAVLVRFRSPLAAVVLPPRLARQAGLQAASPAREAQRLNVLVGDAAGLLERLGLALLGLAAAGFIVALSAAVLQRRPEIALLKALGARAPLLARWLLLEGLLLGAAGGLAGVAAGRLLTALIAHSGAAPISLSAPPVGLLDLGLTIAAALIGAIGAIPALIAAVRVDPVKSLEGAR
ncbi:ABC transporter permease [Brevundimonas sp.]|uniref:ABC transporter permease n=1 Tax=Brevundimonas sp. TaxID=1871086 RepID=UPI0035188CA1